MLTAAIAQNPIHDARATGRRSLGAVLAAVVAKNLPPLWQRGKKPLI
jgi:hypothetical protein